MRLIACTAYSFRGSTRTIMSTSRFVVCDRLCPPFGLHSWKRWITTLRALLISVSTSLATSPELQATDMSMPSYQFRMTHGKGVQVCAAFLKRLDAATYERTPYSGIPEND